MKSKNRGVYRAIGTAELHSPEDKRRYNRHLFAVVATRYDVVTRFLSFGRDQAWKRRLLRLSLSPRREIHRVLDLACGTGDITLALHQRFPHSQVTGLDLTGEMIHRAQRRASTLTHHGTGSLTFVEGDMNALPLGDAQVDLVTGGYALRNAPDLDHALSEVYRVLRPAGWALFLDFSAPPAPILRALQYRVLRFWGEVWGVVLHGDLHVYGYIARSLRVFPTVPELAHRAERAGFAVRYSPLLMGGMMQILRLEKPSRES